MARWVSSVLTTPILGSPVLAAVARWVSCVLTTPVFGSPGFCKFSPTFPQPNISLLRKMTQIMSLPTVKNVFFVLYGHLSLAFDIYLFSLPPSVEAIII
ncbi:hypothetical protein EDB86DRAFT_2971003 [Lactarius hatsudake]|nr:hypothetical protein EDB86DRAFT_2971003 [Lactarius hatsudake]